MPEDGRPTAASRMTASRARAKDLCVVMRVSLSGPPARGGGRDEPGVESGQSLGERTGPVAPADHPAVDLAHAGHAAEGARDERLVGAVALGQREIRLANGDAVARAQLDQVAPRDAHEVVASRRGPYLVAADDEEVGRVAARHEAVRVEHQGFVGAGLDRLDE